MEERTGGFRLQVVCRNYTPPMDRERERDAVEEATRGCMLRSDVAVAALRLGVVCGDGRDNGRF